MKKISVILAAVSLTLICGTAWIWPAYGEDSKTKNPYEGNQKMVKEGKLIFDNNCKSCHGEGAKGDICPDLTTKKKKYGNADTDLFTTISKGRPGGMPNWDNNLGKDKIWKVITYIRSVEK